MIITGDPTAMEQAQRVPRLSKWSAAYKPDTPIPYPQFMGDLRWALDLVMIYEANLKKNNITPTFDL